jgi:predicted nucleic acid-binding protein
MNIQDDFIFFAPELLKEELKRYAPKIAVYSKLDQKELFEIETLILSTINFFSEELISENSWHQAIALTKDIDDMIPHLLQLNFMQNCGPETKYLPKALLKKM